MGDGEPDGRTYIQNDLVIVTGASGFVGRSVVDQLRKQGAQVLALGKAPAGKPLPGVEWQSVDLLEADAAATLLTHYKASILIHAAWARAKAGGLWHLEENWIWRDASLRLFNEFWDRTGGHVVACGTCAEYDPPDHGECEEDITSIAPSSIYGRAKAELAEQAFTDAQKAGGSLTWARLFYLFGPFENTERLVPQIIDPILAGETAETGSGKAVRDFGFAPDMASGLATLAARRCRGAFNVGTGEGISIKALASRIAELCGREDLLHVGALPDRQGEAPRIVANTQKLRAATGWSPAYDLDTGLRDTIAWRHEALRR
ncbi:NAD-dependent epimerase/dehydratase family protein [Erythrobacter ani]|uniref:NAD(P)-dependent oxidoreductase n=1 Tax=Erythrobacter ani TaxID=2827235 RepID=A0ABS6SMM1_9SPHN|nr:NAD(P)-dependent oxidoreductase [Erythrobacter ani]MBV7266293.1 NAD(P)-dependent oxidoreductase [Erythrobacter ani]